MGKDRDRKDQETSNDNVDEERREVVVRLGKLAAYTPPAMMALMVSRKATAQSVGVAN